MDPCRVWRGKYVATPFFSLQKLLICLTNQCRSPRGFTRKNSSKPKEEPDKLLIVGGCSKGAQGRLFFVLLTGG